MLRTKFCPSTILPAEENAPNIEFVNLDRHCRNWDWCIPIHWGECIHYGLKWTQGCQTTKSEKEYFIKDIYTAKENKLFESSKSAFLHIIYMLIINHLNILDKAGSLRI